jgi:hypothetical protein
MALDTLEAAEGPAEYQFVQNQTRGKKVESISRKIIRHFEIKMLISARHNFIRIKAHAPKSSRSPRMTILALS